MIEIRDNHVTEFESWNRAFNKHYRRPAWAGSAAGLVAAARARYLAGELTVEAFELRLERIAAEFGVLP